MTEMIIWSNGGGNNGKTFSQHETDMILKDLKASARQYAISCGMRKITVEEFAKEASISKGAFYKFYLSKEMLF